MGSPWGRPVSCPFQGGSERVWWWRVAAKVMVLTPGGEIGSEGELWRGFRGNWCWGVGESYHAVVIREGDVSVCCEGGRGEGRFRIVPEGLDRFESGWGERACRAEDRHDGFRHLGLPDRV